MERAMEYNRADVVRVLKEADISKTTFPPPSWAKSKPVKVLDAAHIVGQHGRT